MAESIESIATWTFMREIDLPSDIASILIDGEQPFAAYATIRDAAIFTNKRLIIRDSQGITYGQENRNVLLAVELNQYVVIGERWFYGRQF